MNRELDKSSLVITDQRQFCFRTDPNRKDVADFATLVEYFEILPFDFGEDDPRPELLSPRLRTKQCRLILKTLLDFLAEPPDAIFFTSRLLQSLDPVA